MQTTTNGNKRIGECLKDARRTLGVSRIDLARRLHCSKKDILKYENGVTRIPLDFITDFFCAGIRSEIKPK